MRPRASSTAIGPPVGRRTARRRRWRAARARARWRPDRGAARSRGRRARAAVSARARSAARRARPGSRRPASRSPTCRQAAPRASAHSTRTGRRLPSIPCRKGSGNEPTTAGVRALDRGDVGPHAVAAVDLGVVAGRDAVDASARRCGWPRSERADRQRRSWPATSRDGDGARSRGVIVSRDGSLVAGLARRRSRPAAARRRAGSVRAYVKGGATLQGGTFAS